MAEYRQSAHAVYDLKYHIDLVHEVPKEDSQGPDSGACARPDTSDLCCQRGVDHQRSGIAGSYSSAAVSTADPCTGEAGAGHQGAVVQTDAGGVSGVEEAVLGTTHVGARLLLRDGGRGGRGNDQGLYRESAVGRRRRVVQDHSDQPALSRLVA